MSVYRNIGGKFVEVARPQVNLNGVVRQVEQGWMMNNGVWKPLWIVYTLPMQPAGWVLVKGRSDGSPGIYFWGGTRRYCRFVFDRDAIITGVKITVTYRKGSMWGCKWRVGENGEHWPYQYFPNNTPVLSPWLNCYVKPNEELRIYGDGLRSSGEADIVSDLVLSEIRYAT